jgi:hypothetical protein
MKVSQALVGTFAAGLSKRFTTCKTIEQRMQD